MPQLNAEILATASGLIYFLEKKLALSTCSGQTLVAQVVSWTHLQSTLTKICANTTEGDVRKQLDGEAEAKSKAGKASISLSYITAKSFPLNLQHLGRTISSTFFLIEIPPISEFSSSSSNKQLSLVFALSLKLRISSHLAVSLWLLCQCSEIPFQSYPFLSPFLYFSPTCSVVFWTGKLIIGTDPPWQPRKKE